MARVRWWIERDPDEENRAELAALLSAAARDPRAVAELADRFSGTVGFGTAGLRALVGAGPARMNRIVVRRAAAGVAAWLRAAAPTAAPSVVIGWDARHGSAAFAAEVSAVLAAAGVAVHRLPRPLPTPVLAFAVGYLQASAGVMVTASHNPVGYNGLKVYAGDGAQVAPPAEDELAAAIEAVPGDERVPTAAPVPPAASDEVVAAYEDAVLESSLVPGARSGRLLLTPLHGVGGAVAERVLRRAGFEVELVGAQAEPDGSFPTVANPNPEDPETFDLALRQADDCGADLVLALDPDADRLGAAVPAGPGWRILRGDEIGALLGDHVLAHTQGADRSVATSIVSCRLLQRMAQAAGVHYADTLTGFKWIARAADGHPGWRPVFAYEEALGFQVCPAIRDKDGIAAALVLAEVAAVARAEGVDLPTRLEHLAERFGRFRTDQVVVPVGEGTEAPAAVLDRLVATPPAELGGRRVDRVVDHRRGAEGLPPAALVAVHLAGGGRVLVRPSGTEPKIKCYLEVVGDPDALVRLRAAASRLLAVA